MLYRQGGRFRVLSRGVLCVVVSQNILYFLSTLFDIWGRGGAVVRALAFYTDAPSSIPGKGKNQAIGRSPVDPAVNGYLVL